MGEIMRKFVEGHLYIALLFLVGIFNWVFETAKIYSAFMVLITIIIVGWNLPRKALIPLIFGMMIAYNHQQFDLYHLVCGGVVILILIFDLIRHRQYKLSVLIIGFLVWISSMIMSIFTSLDPHYVLLGIGQALIWLLILYYSWVHRDEGTLTYIFHSFAYLSAAILVEIILSILMQLNQPLIEVFRTLDLGWGSYPQISIIYLIAMVLTTYWFLQDERKIGLFYLILFQGLMASIFTSKGTYLAMLLLAVPYMILFFQNTKRRQTLAKILIGYLIFALLFRLLVATPTGMRTAWYERVNLMERFDKDIIFQLGLDAFYSNPLFGIGAYNSPIFLQSLSLERGITYYYFQNYFLQTLATLGILGMVAFGFFLISIIRYLRKKTLLNYFIGIIIGIYLIQGFFDTTFYSMILMSFLAIILSMTEEEKGVYINVYN